MGEELGNEIILNVGNNIWKDMNVLMVLFGFVLNYDSYYRNWAFESGLKWEVLHVKLL